MRAIRLLITLFLVSVTGLSVFGLVWWRDPPAQLVDSAVGGRSILALLILGCAVGLWRLWA